MDKTIAKHVEEILSIIKEKNEQVAQLNSDINGLVKTLEDKMKYLKNIQNTPQTFVSRLVTTPTITNITQNPNIPSSSSLSNPITMADKLKYPEEYVTAYEKISKYYDYKSNTTIVRPEKFSKYPRYICRTNADPTIVKNLLSFGFIDKILTDETLSSISKCPSMITQSVQAMMKSFGPGGIFGIQIFDACTDLTGKPILLCQLYKARRGANEEGDDTNLKIPVPCTLAEFGNWLCTKRAIGLSTIKSKLEDMIRGRKACVIGTGQGGDVEDIITLYYNNDVMNIDTTQLTVMQAKVSALKHKHAEKTMEIARPMLLRRAITLSSPAKEGGSVNPFE